MASLFFIFPPLPGQPLFYLLLGHLLTYTRQLGLEKGFGVINNPAAFVACAYKG